MPTVIAGAALSGAFAAASGATILGLTGVALGFAVAGANLALGLLSRALQPDVPSLRGIAQEGLTRQIKQPITTRKIVYGESRVSGPILYYATTGDRNKFLHYVIALASHEVEEIKEVIVNDFSFTDDMLDSDGFVNKTIYKDKIRIRKFLGTDAQVADPDLISETSSLPRDQRWTSNHKLSGIAYIYLRLEYDRDIFPSGIPNFSAYVKGKKIFDPRDSVTKYTANTSLMVRDYLVDGKYGFGASSDEINDTVLNASANVSDEMVEVEDYSETAKISSKNITFSSLKTENINFREFESFISVGDKIEELNIQTGTIIKYLGGGWQNITPGTEYYAIVVDSQDPNDKGTAKATLKLALTLADALADNSIVIDSGDSNVTGSNVSKANFKFNNSFGVFDTINNTIEFSNQNLFFQTGDRVKLSTTGSLPTGLITGTDYYIIVYAHKYRPRIQLATSLDNALAGTAINFSGQGSGDPTVTKNAEPRYFGGGVVDLGDEKGEIIENILTACAGRAIYAGGTWSIIAGSYTSPTITLDENDFVSGFNVQTKLTRAERFNTVKGTYVSPINNAEPSDYPAVTNPAYIENDNNEQIIKDIPLPFTQRPHTAQRVAKIELEKARQEIVFSANFKLSAIRLQAGDTVNINNTQLGFSNKVFEVTGWQLKIEDQNGAPLPVVNMTLRETAPTVYDWNKGEETLTDPAPNTTLPTAINVSPPGKPSVVESLFVARQGGGLKVRIDVSAAASDDQFVTNYQFRYRPSDESDDYVTLPITDTPSITIFDIKPDTYDFEVKAINNFGVSSFFIVSDPISIQGLSAAPQQIQNLSLQAISSIAVLKWDQSPDLDVRIGGRIEFRHSRNSTDWQNSVSIGKAVNGAVTETLLPLKEGNYLLRPFDSSNIKGPVTVINTDAATALEYSNIGSVQEDPNFSGEKTNIVFDASANKISLSGGTNIDDLTNNIDTYSSIDYAGGVETQGTYIFDSGIDLTTQKRVRLVTDLDTAALAVNDLIDNRTNNIDDWQDFDGTDAADVDAYVEVRTTNDDPTASPTWSDWGRIEVGEYNNRAFEFRLILQSNDPAYTIECDRLRVNAEEVI